MHCKGKISENIAIVLQKWYNLIVQFYKLQNLISDIKNVTYRMIKSANKKRFKKDIYIFWTVNTVNNMETQIVTVTFLAQFMTSLNLCGFFKFGLMDSNMEIRLQFKGKISILFLPKFYWQYEISKKVSLSMRRLRELNSFGPMGPNM